MKRKWLLAAVLAAVPWAAWAETYALDPAHSSVGFAVRHLMVSKVRGSFGTFSAKFVFDPEDPKIWKVEATISAGSIDTGIEKRDEHLRAPDFLDAAKYPVIEFKSTGVEKGKDGSYKLKGDLTLHGVTRPVVLDLEVNGIAKAPWGEMRAGFSASTKISRKDFGLTWNQALETGGVAISDEIEVRIEAEGAPEK